MLRSFSGRHAAVGNEGVMLYGVVAQDQGSPLRVPGVTPVSLRDLVALVCRVPYARVDASSSAIAEYRGVVEGVFRERPIVPAPFGTVFRSRDALVRWMELHYVALVEALGFVQGKAAARVRLAVPTDTAGAEFETAVFESMRFLKRHAVACVSMPDESERGHRTADASFLVEREKWSAFDEALREEKERYPDVVFEKSGPWPAYDFVRLQFGG